MSSRTAILLHCLLSATFLAIVLFLPRSLACAQTGVPLPIPADCMNAGLQTTLHVYRAPSHTQVIAVDYFNTTVNACILRPDLIRAQGPLLTLTPGATAHTSFRWSTEPSRPDVPCREVPFRTINANRPPDGIERFPNGLMLDSPLILPRVCSEVRFDPYLAGPFVPDWPVESVAIQPQTSILRLAVAKPTYYGERLTFHLTIDRLTSQLPTTKYGCPIIFRTLRNLSGFTQIDEITPSHWKPCMPSAEKAGTSEFDAAFDIDADQGSSSAEQGEKTYRYSQLIGYSPQGELLFADSNPVTLKFDPPPDPTKISRKWGQTEQGVRVDLTLDKLTYSLGEDVPLHIAAEVLSAAKPVYAARFGPRAAFFSDFTAAFRLTISDEDGPLPGSERPDNLSYGLFGGSSGPVICPGPITQGKVIPLERSLKHLGLLPTRPGTYKVVVSWSPYTTQYSSCDDVPRFDAAAPREQPFVTVTSAPLTIHITGEPASAGGISELHEYTAWKSHFALSDTSFGKQTALLDQATHLEWLRVSLSAGLSEEAVRKAMEPGGRFEGWRFGTIAEVGTFFAHFTGSPDGRSTDPAIERKLQRLLGGPLDTMSNDQTGWSRKSTPARIAGLTPATHEQTPQHPATPAGASPPCPTCGVGFIFHAASIYEDTSYGHTQIGVIDAHVDPDGGSGWTIGDGTGGSNSGIFLVRER
jgi:hypothetical protein